MGVGVESVGLLDIGLGNVQSIDISLRRSGISSFRICSEGDNFPSIVVLPGVGHFSAAASRLESSGMRAKILDHVKSGGGLIGICLGMQLLGRSSEEGEGLGLGLLDYVCEDVNRKKTNSLPITGWQIPSYPSRDFWMGAVEGDRFYFMHDFGVRGKGAPFEKMLHRNRDGETFVAGVQSGKVVGFQFHPERSLDFGQRILANAVKDLSI